MADHTLYFYQYRRHSLSALCCVFCGILTRLVQKKGRVTLEVVKQKDNPHIHCLMYRFIKRYFRKKGTRKRLKEAVGKDRNEVKGGQHEKGSKRTATGYHQKQR